MSKLPPERPAGVAPPRWAFPHVKVSMANEFTERMRSVGIISKRTRDTVREGKDPDTGRPYKATTDELGNTVTEHTTAGRAPGVSDRQDVTLRPKTVHLEIGVQG